MKQKKSRDEWKVLVARWKNSGLSQKEYCAQEGLSYARLKYWAARVLSEQKSGLTLVPVRLSDGVGNMIIRGPKGWQCVLPTGTPASWVAEVLRSL